MDEYLRAILLGIVQAVTEFLPISSSGHLVLAPGLAGDEASSITFDVGLHLGTLVAVLVYFWRDWAGMTVAAATDLRAQGVDARRWSQQGQVGLMIALATVPAAVVGLLFEGWIEDNARTPFVVGVTMLLGGVVMGAADRWGAHVGRLVDMTPLRALGIGAAQALSLIPGVSRSAATIVAARALGFDRTASARFSFLLSAPIVFGAGAMLMLRGLGSDEIEWGPMLAGALVAGVVGALVIKGFLAFLQRATLAVFVWYRIALGSAVLVAVAFGVL
jgi:undecaprenyl-diphosphatase